MKELEYAKQQIAAFQEHFKKEELFYGLDAGTLFRNAKITQNNKLIASYKKLLPLIEKAAGKQRKFAGLDTQDVGLSDPKAPENQAVLESMKATVTGGRRNNVVNVNIGTAVNIEDLINQTGEGTEEAVDRLTEVIVRAISEGALQGRAVLGGH